jgi:uncharacterized protein (TIGR02996 family)
MTDDAALLAATLAHPREDTPRLALADWFDERGESDYATPLRNEPELIPLLASLTHWDCTPSRFGNLWATRQEGLALAASRFLARYRHLFPTPPDAPAAFDPTAKPSPDYQATPGPLPFIDRWINARTRQVAGLRERAARLAGGATGSRSEERSGSMTSWTWG